MIHYPACHNPTSEQARRCAHCGADIMAASVARSPTRDLACPRCHRTTNAVSLGAIEVDVCSRCGGIWFDPGELEKLPEEFPDPQPIEDVLASLSGHHAPAAAHHTEYLPCYGQPSQR